MTPLALILRELLHRKANALLTVLSVAAAVALFVAFLVTSVASQRETVRIQRDMGFNLRIIPKDTDMDRFWAEGYPDRTLPEDALERLARNDRVFLSYNHLVAALHGRIELGGKEALLTGLSLAVTAPAQAKQPMGYRIPAGKVFLGHRIAGRLGRKKGDALEIAGEKFQVERCLAESGTDEDIRVYALLADAQRVLKLPGKIHEIQAIDCLCLPSDRDPLSILRGELAKILPEASVIQLRAIADGRARQRRMAEGFAAFIVPFVLVLSAASVCLLAVLNVRERRLEIGILRALGHGSGRIAALFLGKAALLGLLGALLGDALGAAAALVFGPEIFPVTAGAVRAEPLPLAGALLAAPAFAALASLIPTALAVTQDPAAALREA